MPLPERERERDFINFRMSTRMIAGFAFLFSIGYYCPIIDISIFYDFDDTILNKQSQRLNDFDS